MVGEPGYGNIWLSPANPIGFCDRFPVPWRRVDDIVNPQIGHFDSQGILSRFDCAGTGERSRTLPRHPKREPI